MKNFNIILLISAIIAISCNGQSDSQKNTISMNELSINPNQMTDNILKKQLLEGAYQFAPDGSDVSKPPYQEQELVSLVEFENQILKDAGYKKHDDTEFSERIYSIFKRRIDQNSDKKFLYVNLLDKCNYSDIKQKSNGVDYRGFYIIKNQNFITDFYYLPELIDYKNKFPKLFEEEKKMPEKVHNNLFNMEVEIQKWRDVEDLAQQQNKNRELVLHRNNYLFRSNKASFTWLQFNDKFFLESLVKIFGYVQDKNLLNFVLNNNYKNQDEFYKILWNERCDGTIVFNNEVMDLISESSDEQKELYLNAISNYLVKEVRNKESALNNNFSKKAEILGKLAYYSSKIGDPIGKYYEFFNSLNGNGNFYEKEFEKNNYYNISDFKKIWEETRMGGISLPGME